MATSDVQSLIVSTAQQYGVDPALALAVANQESGFNQSAVSSAGAVGVFQLMPATAAGLGVNANDLTGNITGGIKYLSQLISQYGGDTTLALAAYNAGPGNVAKYGGVPPFSETQSYISSILSSIENFASSLFDSGSSSASIDTASPNYVVTDSTSDASDTSDDSSSDSSGLDLSGLTGPIAIGAGLLLVVAILRRD